jgi:hypothetical protein
MPIVTSKLLPTLPLTCRQALGVINMTTAMPEAAAVTPVSNAAPVSPPLLPCSSPLSSLSLAAATVDQPFVQITGSRVHTSFLPLTSLTPAAAHTSSSLIGGSEMHTSTNIHSRSHAHTMTNTCNNSDSNSSHNYLPLTPCSMSTNTPAECLHAEPKHIPLLIPGEVSPMVMCQWEMACEDFFSANSKLEEMDHVAAILPGLKDMRARDWVATHRSDLTLLSFADFMKSLHREFLTEGWDDELHACICNVCLQASDLFAKWVNDICHMNIILHGTDYHFSDDSLRFQLDSLLDTDLHTHCKNRKIKDIVEGAINVSGIKTPEAHLMMWIAKVCKLAEECSHNTRHYLEASEDFQCAPKRQALGTNSCVVNIISMHL